MPASTGTNISTDTMMAPKLGPDKALLATMRVKHPALELLAIDVAGRDFTSPATPHLRCQQLQ